MPSLSSPSVRVGLIAGGGVLVTVTAALAIVVLYCCSCRRRKMKKKKEKCRTRQKPAGLEEGGPATVQLVSHSGRQPLTTQPSSLTLDQFRGSTDTIPTFTSELTSLSLSRLDSSTDGLIPPFPPPPNPSPQSSSLPNHHELLEVQMRTPSSRRGTTDQVESELEISQKTWSAYESLPRGLTRFPSEREKERIKGKRKEEITAALSRKQTEIEVREEEEIETEENDAYSSTEELESLRRQTKTGEECSKENHTPSENHTHSRFNFLFPAHAVGPAHHRFSTVSTVSSNSGYVISSLNSPIALNSPRERDRASCYSTGSEGYVINSLEWACGGRPTALPQLRPPLLPRIVEGSPTNDYLHIIAT